jgi:hypothetical protein
MTTANKKMSEPMKRKRDNSDTVIAVARAKRHQVNAPDTEAKTHLFEMRLKLLVNSKGSDLHLRGEHVHPHRRDADANRFAQGVVREALGLGGGAARGASIPRVGEGQDGLGVMPHQALVER